MNKKQSLNTENGFTLIEAMIALLILVIGVLSFYTMHTQSITGNKVSNAISLSSEFVMDQAEQLFPKSYSDADLTAGVHNWAGNMPGGVKSISWNVVEWRTDGVDNDMDGITDENDERGIKEVTYTSTYNNRGNDRTVTITFLKTEIL